MVFLLKIVKRNGVEICCILFSKLNVFHALVMRMAADFRLSSMVYFSNALGEGL